MQAILRKRVTRVGSGAFSIYLPKKWIDRWTPQQQEDRQVDLHEIGQALLIAPVLQDHTLSAAIDPTTKAVRRWLLSAYIRGQNEVELTPKTGTFDNDAIIAGRDFLRHLDERLVATSSPEVIGYRLNNDLPPPASTGHELLSAMGAKVLEMNDLAADAVATHGLDADRCLHSLRLLQAIYDEDVSRYFHQAMRMVARIELPLVSVSDFQALDLFAADLHRQADHLLRIGTTLLESYGLGLDDLAYPRDHLLGKIEQRPITPLGRAITHTYPVAFREGRVLLERMLACIQGANTADMADLIGESYAAQADIQQRIFQAVVDHWGEGDVQDAQQAAAGFAAYQLSVPLTNVVGAIGTMARHGLGLLTAAPRDGP